MSMPTELLLMPAGAGKTEFALERLLETVSRQPFAKIWVLVSGRRQEDAFRQRLIEQGGQQVYFNIEFFSFYQLYHRLLNIARQPSRRLDDAARSGLLRAIVTRLQAEGRFSVYSPIAHTPGFIRIVAALISELKQNIIPPEDFAAAAQSAKDKELALIYSQYQAALQAKHQDLVDREGEGWLALALLRDEAAHENIGRDVDLLLVDGYDQFTPLQAELLMLLAGRARQSLITLATVPGREATVGRRFEETRNQLQRASRSQPLILRELPGRVGLRQPDLQYLCAQVFVDQPQAQSAGEGIRLIEAPDVRREMSALLRRVKRLLLAEDCQPDDILIALRDWPRYARHVATYGREYGIPLALHGGEPLAQNPAVIALLGLLNLHIVDFRRRDLLDVLRSTYFEVPGFSAAQVDMLEQISQAFVITGGRAHWLAAVKQASRAPVIEDEDEPIGATLLRSEEAAELHSALLAFFEAVTPPVEASLRDYVRWLDTLIGVDEEADPDDDPTDNSPAYHLHIPYCIRLFADTAARDLVAVHSFKQAMMSLLSAEDLLVALGEKRQISRQIFLTELQTAIASQDMNQAPARAGRVLVTTVTDARGLPHQHVFIPGLAEGIFPMLVPEDPLYLDSERRALNERGIPLEMQAERAADDGLFYELISLAQKSLTLSRPTVQDGAPWVASHLWREVTRVLSNVPEITERILVGGVVRAGEAASSAEALLAVAEALCQPQTDAGWLYNWLLDTQGQVLGRVSAARRMELRRFSRWQRHDRYAGRLSQPELIAYAAAELGPQRVWSASQLNDYGICGFRFFAKRLLKLDALEEPEEGLDARKLGTVNHEILEHVYREVARRGLAITTENQDEALAILNSQAQSVLEQAPRKLGFRDNVLWRQERESLLRRLQTLIKLDFSPLSPVAKLSSAPRRPYLLEAGFGGDDAAVAIPIEVDGKTESLHVRGFIDRMDVTPEGVIVIDYKTGSTKIPVEDMTAGRNFQMMVYLRAAEYVLAARAAPDAPPPVAGGFFWHIRNQKASGEVRVDDEEGKAKLEQAEVHIGRYIAAGRRGDFTVHPAKLDKGLCTHYCEYAQLCRVGGTSRYKPD